MYSATDTSAGVHGAAIGVAAIDFCVYLAFFSGVAVVVEWA
jgi:hypothetical protein